VIRLRRRRQRVTGRASTVLPVADMVASNFPVGPADGEIRAETLQAGDTVRWLQRWHDITRVQHAAWGTYLWIVDDAGTARIVLYRPGAWVAADARRRDEVPV
jgi:hypothetical protein